MAQYEWFEVSADPKRKLAKWMRRVAVSSSGELFVPPAVAGISEMEAFLCAGYDGSEAIVSGDHAYYPADWMAREFPLCAGTVARIRGRLADMRAKQI